VKDWGKKKRVCNMVRKTLETIYTVPSSLVVFLTCMLVNCICLACVVVTLCVFFLLYVYCSFTLDARLLARSQYPEGPATGHLDTGFSWFSCVYKRMLRWFPSFPVATTCFSCSPPDLNFLVLISYLCTCKINTATG
jgi:hypothetical protein